MMMSLKIPFPWLVRLLMLEPMPYSYRIWDWLRLAVGYYPFMPLRNATPGRLTRLDGYIGRA